MASLKDKVFLMLTVRSSLYSSALDPSLRNELLRAWRREGDLHDRMLNRESGTSSRALVMMPTAGPRDTRHFYLSMTKLHR